MSQVSRSEISTRRLPLRGKELEQWSTSRDHELQFMGKDNQNFVIQEVFSADTIIFSRIRGAIYPRAHNLGGELLPNIIMH